MAWREILNRLYQKGLITEAVLDNCVVDGLLTEAEKEEILGL